MDMNKFAFRAAATATRAAYATKDAVTTAASNTKRESKSLFAALKAGYAAARDEHAILTANPVRGDICVTRNN